MRDSIQIIGVKTLIYCIILAVYCMFYITLLYSLIYALSLTMRHLILITFYALTGVLYPSQFYLFKITYKSPNKPYKGMYDSQKLCVLWGKKNPLEPLDRPPYKIQRIARGINYEYYCISAYLPSCE